MFDFLGISTNADIGNIFEGLFFFGLSLVGLAALIMLVFGGMMYLTAGDSADQTKRARGIMTNAIFGVALAFLSWLILYTINPDLIQGLNIAPTKIRQPLTPSMEKFTTESPVFVGGGPSTGGQVLSGAYSISNTNGNTADFCRQNSGRTVPYIGKLLCITPDALQIRPAASGQAGNFNKEDLAKCIQLKGRPVIIAGPGQTYCLTPNP